MEAWSSIWGGEPQQPRQVWRGRRSADAAVRTARLKRRVFARWLTLRAAIGDPSLDKDPSAGPIAPNYRFRSHRRFA